MKNTVVIVLAAGKGTRLKSKNNNKVVLPLAGKPMVSYIIKTLLKMGFKNIYVVVGFAKESVMAALGTHVKYVIQKRRLGTASAVKTATQHMINFKSALILQGDDSALYTAELIRNLLEHHNNSSAVMTLLTIKKENPFGLGRIKRKDGKVISIVEEKNASSEERKIREINAACYVCSTDFLKKYLPKIKINPIKKEYYLTDLVELAVKDNLLIETYRGPEEIFMGVNTQEELHIAESRMKDKIKNKND